MVRSPPMATCMAFEMETADDIDRRLNSSLMGYYHYIASMGRERTLDETRTTALTIQYDEFGYCYYWIGGKCVILIIVVVVV